MGYNEPFCDIAFPVIGDTVPYDNAYLVYSALSGLCPDLHGNEQTGIFHIRSTSTGDGKGILADDAVLKIRCAASLYPALVPLAGKSLDLDGHRVSLGAPSAFPLRPAPAAWAHLVVIKGYTEPDEFRKAAERQLQDLQIAGDVEVGRRNVVRVKDQSIVGFQVVLSGLSDEDSVKLQREGLGGKRRMGCGLFEPRFE